MSGKHFVDFDKNWLANEDKIAQYARISLTELQMKSIDEFMELQELYLDYVEEQNEKQQQNE